MWVSFKGFNDPIGQCVYFKREVTAFEYFGILGKGKG